jgi:hypothetical protein
MIPVFPLYSRNYNTFHYGSIYDIKIFASHLQNCWEPWRWPWCTDAGPAPDSTRPYFCEFQPRFLARWCWLLPNRRFDWTRLRHHALWHMLYLNCAINHRRRTKSNHTSKMSCRRFKPSRRIIVLLIAVLWRGKVEFTSSAHLIYRQEKIIHQALVHTNNT